MSSEINIQSGVLAQALARAIASGFIDQGFINTMRFSELNGDEEYDNTFLYIAWHAYAEYGMQQVRSQVKDLERLKASPDQYGLLAIDERERIEDLMVKAGHYKYERPVDDKQNIWVIRNELADYNENLMDAVMFYDGHIAILNGRMARGRGHKKEIIQLGMGIEDKEKQIAMGNGEKKHFWQRGNSGE